MYISEVRGQGNIIARVVADSISETGKRITTFELEYHRFIHSELMTHRHFSRNAMSSRAVPVSKMIEQVRNTPATPIHWGKNQAGMQAEVENNNYISCPEYIGLDSEINTKEMYWSLCAKVASDMAEQMSNAGYHKQIVNRLLEPFQMMKTVLTATEFDNFFWLRLDPDAQPEIQELAKCMYEAMSLSKPQVMVDGQWHTPYVGFDSGTYYLEEGKEVLTQQDAIAISASCCAQVSYRSLNTNYDKAMTIYEKLLSGGKPHCYDSKTEVLTSNGFKLWEDIVDTDLLADVNETTLEFMGFKKPLALISHNYSGKMFSVDSGDTSFRVTEGHKMIGQIISKHSDRYGDFKPKSYVIGDLSSNKSKFTYLGQMETRLPDTLSVVQHIEPLGKIIGMYIGDGYKVNNTIAFHFKKDRKLKYIEGTLKQLGWDYSLNKEPCGAYYIRVYKNEIVTEILSKCGSGAKNKKIGEWDQCLYVGIFDGLKNSDGSVKRNTWTFSTSSDHLKKDFMDFACLAGLSVMENKRQDSCHRLMVKTKTTSRINDSRKDDSKVVVEDVVDEPVFCATMPSGAVVVRRNGKQLVCGNCSPFEHQATPTTKEVMLTFGEDKWPNGVTHIDSSGEVWSGNFCGWIQHRQLLDNHTCYHYEPK